MVLKPGGGADMMSNFQEMINLANNYYVYKRSVDTGDTNEDKSFGFVTPPMVKAVLRGENPPPLKLSLPRDEPDSPNAISNFPKASQLVVLISGNQSIYAYMGSDIRKGKKYTYQGFTDMLKEKRSDKHFSVVIKPAQSSTYKNTVDMLDVMQIADIQHYALVDITKEEEKYLHQLDQD
jgi:biopolymer transport protein ExbD